MNYLDFEKLAAVDADAFIDTQPFPFINPLNLLIDEAYQRLRQTLPRTDDMQASFGNRRSHGQQSHDRYLLEYSPQLQSVDSAWHDFIAELHGPEYTAFIQRMYQRKSFRLNMHWHYAPRGASVSPHCDAAHKLGSHIFYLNDSDDWQPEWGGETLILDDGGGFKTNSAPGFDDFEQVLSGPAMGNCSTLFSRRGSSWHGVRELTCPEGALRKVFIIVVNQPLLYAGRRALNWIRNK